TCAALRSGSTHLTNTNQPNLVELSRILALRSGRIGQGADCLPASTERVASDPRPVACASHDQYASAPTWGTSLWPAPCTMRSCPRCFALLYTAFPIHAGMMRSRSPWTTETGVASVFTRPTVSKCTREIRRQSALSPGTNIRRAMSWAVVNGDCSTSARGWAVAASSAAMALPSECPKKTSLSDVTPRLSWTNCSAASASWAEAPYDGSPESPSYPRYSAKTAQRFVRSTTVCAHGTSQRAMSAFP